MKFLILWLLHAVIWGSIFLDPVGAALEFAKVFATLTLWVLIKEAK